jgi:hypothetical protein
MKRAITNKICSEIQRDMLLGDDLSDARRRALEEHSHSCHECQAFALLYGNLKEVISEECQYATPRSGTLKYLLRHMTMKQGERKRLTPWLERVLSYRIPVYQLVIMVLLFIGVYWGAVNLHVPKASRPAAAYGIDKSVIHADQAVQILQAAREQKIGRSISEDSLYSRFTFTL